jgi:hypothetical protein
MSGGDHIHTGTVVGKLEGDRAGTLGFVDLLRENYVEQDKSRGVYFTQDWASMGGVMAVASGGIHVWHMPALVEIFGDDSVLQFGGGTLGHPWGNAPGATANRVALEACVQARNEGRNLAREGGDIIREAASGRLNWLRLVNSGRKSSSSSTPLTPSKIRKNPTHILRYSVFKLDGLGLLWQFGLGYCLGRHVLKTFRNAA